MGKASKWIINLLLGKKDEKAKKKIDVSFLAEYVNPDSSRSSSVFPPPTPKIKRRWSFGKSAGKGTVKRTTPAHKLSRSMDSAEIAKQLAVLEKQTKGEPPLLQDQARVTATLSIVAKDIRDVAATKIQAVFRSYLAKKALCALRSLVKLQALVRGFLVRKQASATFRSLRALMSIQVRARVQRIQMADQETLSGVISRRRSIHGNPSYESGNNRKLQRASENEAMDGNALDTCRFSKSSSSYLNRPKLERVERGFTTCFAEDLSVLRQGQQYEEFYFSSAQNTPRNNHNLAAVSRTKSTRASFTFQHTDYIDSPSQSYPFVPHYMVNTESSRAKTRSQSEPKQRPKWSAQHKSKRTPSVDGTSTRHKIELPDFALGTKMTARENQDPWFVKLYRPKRSSKDSESDSTCTLTSHSNYSRSLIAYEPHLAMY